MNVNKNTVTLLFELLCNACLRRNMDVDGKLKFQKLVVDETYFGSRKANRGKQVRKRGTWFVTLTEDLAPKTGRTVWYAVKKRDRLTLEKLVGKHIVGSRSLATSDKHKGYLHLKEICRHHAVNHSIEFKTEEGYHTNIAECIHRVIKGSLTEQHRHFGETDSALKRNIALQCVKYGGKAKDNSTIFCQRLINLLICIRDFYSTEEMDVSTLSSDSIGSSEDIAEVTKLDKPPSERLTKRGLSDRRSKSHRPKRMSSIDRFILVETNPDVHTSKSKSKKAPKSAKKAPVPEPKKAAKTNPRKSVTFVNVDNSPAQVIEEPTLGTQVHVKKGHEKYRSNDWTDTECETMLRKWRAVTGGVHEPGEIALSDLQCAQKWCHAHQEDIAQMPEFARDVEAVDDEEVSRSLRGASLILSPAVMLALNMYRQVGYEIVNCQIFSTGSTSTNHLDWTSLRCGSTFQKTGHSFGHCSIACIGFFA